MSHSSFRQPDRIFVLVDIDDPITYDKEFQRALQYSPFVAGASEMSPRNRKLLRARSEVQDELFINKFIIEVFVDKMGDFIMWFVPNPETQRSLIFRKLHWEGPDIEDIPDEVLKQMEEDGVDPEEAIDEEQELLHVYELQSGPALLLHDDEESEKQEPVDTSELDEALEKESGEGKIVPETPKTLH